MLHKVQHLFLSTSVSAQSCSRRGGRDGKREGWMGEGERKMGHVGGDGEGGEKEIRGEERNDVKREAGRGEGEKRRGRMQGEMRNGKIYTWG